MTSDAERTGRRRPHLGPHAYLLAGVIAVGVAMRLYRFDAPILDSHGFRQTQTASVPWLWDRFGFDPLSYRMPMFGAGHWVLEFPSYEIVVWVLSHAGLGIEHSGRIVSIAAYAVAAVMIYVLGARAFASRAGGLAAAAVFTVLPATVFYFRTVMIDPFLIAVILVTTLCAGRLALRFSWGWWAAFSAGFIVALLSKPTLVLAIGGPMVVLGARVVLRRGAPRAHRAAMVGTGAVGVVLLALWTRHAEALNRASDSDWVSDNYAWYFGSTFTSTHLWSTVFQRFEDNLGVVGSALAVAGVLLIARVRSPYRLELAALVVGGLLSIGIFANLNTIHDYYQLPYYVTLALLVGLAIGRAHDAVATRSPHLAAAAAAALIVVFGVTWSQVTWDGYFGPAAVAEGFRGQGLEMANATPPEGRLLLVQENGDRFEPIVWYEARRVGWRVRSQDEAEAVRIARTTADLSGIVFLRGAAPEPTYVAREAFARGFQRTFESPAMVVYTAPR